MSDVKSILSAHPGVFLLEEFMRPHGISSEGLARGLRVPVECIDGFIKDERPITMDLALRLSRYFNTSAQVWLNLQNRYDLDKAEDDGLILRIAQEVRPLAVGG